MAARAGICLLAVLLAGAGRLAGGQQSRSMGCRPGSAGFNALQDHTEAANAAAFLPKLELARCLDMSWKFSEVAPAVELAITAFQSESHTAAPKVPSGLALAGRDVSVPTRVKMTPALYTDQAASAGLTGIVIVEAMIDREGRVKRAEIAQSVPGLDDTALQAARQWRFAPAVANGRVVEVLTYLPMKFGQSSTLTAGDHLELARFFHNRGLWDHALTSLASARDTGRRDADRIGMFAEDVKPGRTSGVSWPQAVKEEKPRYTASAMRAKVMGTVELDILIDRNGDVARTLVTKPLPMLTLVAEQAAMQWKFKPALFNGQPVSIKVGLLLEFRLKQ